MGLEKLVLKKGKMVGYFIADQQSEYFQSATFTKILQYVQAHAKMCALKEKQTRNGLRLLLVFEGINTLDKALKAMRPFEVGTPVMSS